MAKAKTPWPSRASYHFPANSEISPFIDRLRSHHESTDRRQLIPKAAIASSRDQLGSDRRRSLPVQGGHSRRCNCAALRTRQAGCGRQEAVRLTATVARQIATSHRPLLSPDYPTAEPRHEHESGRHSTRCGNHVAPWRVGPTARCDAACRRSSGLEIKRRIQS